MQKPNIFLKWCYNKYFVHLTNVFILAILINTLYIAVNVWYIFITIKQSSTL